MRCMCTMPTELSKKLDQNTHMEPEDIALLLLASVQDDRKSWEPGIYPDTYQGHTDVPGIGIVRCVYQMKNDTVSVRSFYPIENKEAEDYVGLGKS